MEAGLKAFGLLFRLCLVCAKSGLPGTACSERPLASYDYGGACSPSHGLNMSSVSSFRTSLGLRNEAFIPRAYLAIACLRCLRWVALLLL